MKLPSIARVLTMFTCCILTAATTVAQGSMKLQKTVLYHDSIFWEAYNKCDIETMEQYFTDDVEFYHDKAGLTTSKKKFFESIRSGMCGNPDLKLRREPLPETISVFPLENYGAILYGEHIFYIIEKGKNERLDGRAKFTHVWRSEAGEWKMHRILSYDHGPAGYRNQRREITLPESLLNLYAGEYRSPNAGVITIKPEGNTLRLTAAGFQCTMYPASQNTFFLKERDLQFEFVKEKKNVTKIIVQENGKMVEEAERINAK